MRVRVREVTVESAPEPRLDVSAQTSLIEDLGYQSLAMLELGFILEEEFDIALIDTESPIDVRTVGELEEWIVEKIEERLAQ